MSKLLDSILSDSNIALATKQVKANGGSGGIDNITIEQIDEYMLNNMEHYGYYDDIEDAIGALLDIKDFMGEDDEI